MCDRSIPGFPLYRRVLVLIIEHLAFSILYESVLLSRLDCPVAAFTWIVPGPPDFDELLVGGQAVSDAVLPPAVCEAIICEVVLNPLIHLCKCQAAPLRPEHGHADKCSIAVS